MSILAFWLHARKDTIDEIFANEILGNEDIPFVEPVVETAVAQHIPDWNQMM